MEKLKLHSPDLTQENIAKLAELFPSCVTETQAEDGKLKRAIDFDQLRQELSTAIVEGPQERYQLNWPGKREALLTANAPIAKTLRPCREESGDFDTTQNLFIEGDNLDALKLLQETYLNKVKMIYIDPPYNTGNDLLYDDDFKEDSDTYLRRSNQNDVIGNRLVANTESNGRYHSDWLSMIYPRLKLSRNLLRDDGVIFISIDDNESANLKKACDEIFGEKCFVADVCVVNNLKGRNDKKFIATANERLLMYVKSHDFSEYGLDIPESMLGSYKEKDNNGIFRPIELRKRGGSDTRVERPNMFYPFYVNPENGAVSLEKSDKHVEEALPIKSDGVEGRWRWGKDTALKNIDSLFARKVVALNKYNIYEKDYLESDGEIRRIKPKTVLSGASYSTDTATKQYRALMSPIDFSNPKSVAMIEDLVTYSTDPSEHIILDFFSGSGTTAHAVFSRNAQDSGKRKFIMVQLPEPCDEKSEAFKEGYKTIAEICKERIRRAGKKIKEDNAGKDGIDQLDIGFRVLKIDSSNMKDVYYVPDAVQQGDLLAQVDNIRENRTPEDLLFQVLLDWGVDLALPITQDTIAGKQVFFVDGNALAACFETGINEEFVKALAARHPLRAVFRDAGFGSDSVKINIEQIFKLISPTTEVKSI